MRRTAAAFSILALLAAVPAGRLSAGALQLNLTDNWITPSFGTANLAGGAGTDFASSTWTSAVNAAELEVKFSSGPTGWNITVRKVNSAGWAGTTLRLDVQRTGAGSGGATISGGTTYQEITSTDTLFFNGVGGDKKNIPLQYRVRNLSVAQGAGTFSTTVYYTVTEY